MIGRLHLFWGGVAIVAACGVAAGSTRVEAIRVGILVVACFLLLAIQLVGPLEVLAGEAELPRVIVWLGVVSILGDCLWLLSIPDHQGIDGTFVAVAEMFGHGSLDDAAANRFATLAWAGLGVGLIAGGLSFYLSELERRRRLKERSAWQ